MRAKGRELSESLNEAVSYDGAPPSAELASD